MKKTLIASTLILLMGASVAMANPGFGGKGIERLKSALGLDDYQSSQIDSLMQERQERMEALRAEYDARIQSLLNPEQASKFAQMQQRGGPRGEGHGGRRGERQGQGDMGGQ